MLAYIGVMQIDVKMVVVVVSGKVIEAVVVVTVCVHCHEAQPIKVSNSTINSLQRTDRHEKEVEGKQSVRMRNKYNCTACQFSRAAFQFEGKRLKV